MQNKPNLCVFWAVSDDCEEKQTQSNPIQSQNKAIFGLSAPLQSQNKPNPPPHIIRKNHLFAHFSCKNTIFVEQSGVFAHNIKALWYNDDYGIMTAGLEGY